jgi:hypothetical protein
MESCFGQKCLVDRVTAIWTVTRFIRGLAVWNHAFLIIWLEDTLLRLSDRLWHLHLTLYGHDFSKKQFIDLDYRHRTVFLFEERMRFLPRDALSKYWKEIIFLGSGYHNQFVLSMADFLQKNSIYPCAYLACNWLYRALISLVADKWRRC